MVVGGEGDDRCHKLSLSGRDRCHRSCPLNSDARGNENDPIVPSCVGVEPSAPSIPFEGSRRYRIPEPETYCKLPRRRECNFNEKNPCTLHKHSHNSCHCAHDQSTLCRFTDGEYHQTADVDALRDSLLQVQGEESSSMLQTDHYNFAVDDPTALSCLFRYANFYEIFLKELFVIRSSSPFVRSGEELSPVKTIDKSGSGRRNRRQLVVVGMTTRSSVGSS